MARPARYIKTPRLFVSFKVTGIKRFRMKIWFAIRIIKFGAWIARSKLRVKLSLDKETMEWQ